MSELVKCCQLEMSDCEDCRCLKSDARISFEHFKGALEACGQSLVKAGDSGMYIKNSLGFISYTFYHNELSTLGWDLGWLDEKEPSHE